MSQPFADVLFQGSKSGIQKQPQEVRIRQREYAHDVAVITLRFDKKMQDKYAFGRPVTIRWGWLPDDTEYFHGYVHHVEQSDKHTKLKTISIYCVGASYPMKDIKLRSFKKKQAHQVAAQIAKEHKLSLTVQHNAFVHDHLTQHGRSDWDFLVWLAKRIGYTLYCTRTDVTMVKRVIDTKPSRTRPTFKYEPSRWRQRNACYHLDHSIGETVPGTHKRIRQIQGIDDSGRMVKAINRGTVFHTGGRFASAAPLFHDQLVRPVHTSVQAKQAVDSMADLHRFNIIGTASLSGSTKVHQGSTIRIIGIDAESNGLWWVSEADHVITPKGYTLETKLGRDALGDVVRSDGKTGDADQQESSAGKPVLLTDCDVSADLELTPVPQTIFNPVDDCPPVDAVSTAPVGPDPGFVVTPLSSPARRYIYDSRPIPSRTRGAPALQRKKAVTRPPKLDAWRASQHIVRMVR